MLRRVRRRCCREQGAGTRRPALQGPCTEGGPQAEEHLRLQPKEQWRRSRWWWSWRVQGKRGTGWKRTRQGKRGTGWKRTRRKRGARRAGTRQRATLLPALLVKERLEGEQKNTTHTKTQAASLSLFPLYLQVLRNLCTDTHSLSSLPLLVLGVRPQLELPLPLHPLQFPHMLLQDPPVLMEEVQLRVVLELG